MSQNKELHGESLYSIVKYLLSYLFMDILDAGWVFLSHSAPRSGDCLVCTHPRKYHLTKRMVCLPLCV